MIDYRPPIYKKLNISTNLNVKHIKKHPIIVAKCLARVNRFSSTTKRLYRKSKRVYNGEEIDSLRYDVIVYGSDAIFNAKHKLFTDVYMGFGVHATDKVAYAPSCENLPPDFHLNENCRMALKSFKSISVRDINTQLLLNNNLGITPPIVCDPTLLYEFKEIASKWPHRNYVLVYSFSDWNEYARSIQDFAKRKNMTIISVGRHCEWANINYTDASFEEWITSFRYADYVFTDSFHGTVFSIKNRKEMVLVSREDKEAKIVSLLNNAGVSRRFYKGDVSIESYLSTSPIDYTEVTRKMNSLIDHSISFLRDSIMKEQ